MKPAAAVRQTTLSAFFKPLAQPAAAAPASPTPVEAVSATPKAAARAAQLSPPPSTDDRPARRRPERQAAARPSYVEASDDEASDDAKPRSRLVKRAKVEPASPASPTGGEVDDAARPRRTSGRARKSRAPRLASDSSEDDQVDGSAGDDDDEHAGNESKAETKPAKRSRKEAPPSSALPSPPGSSTQSPASPIRGKGKGGAAAVALTHFRRGAAPASAASTDAEVAAAGSVDPAAAARHAAYAARLGGAGTHSGAGGDDEAEGDGDGDGDRPSAPSDLLKLTVLEVAKRLGASAKFTPLEKQVVEFKQQQPDAVLLIECGYRYRFFGEDAEIAAKVLNVCAFPDRHFMAASIPTHRLRVHVGRLVAAGYKVGVVQQTETAALKAVSATKSGPFARKLTALYTRSTFVEEVPDDEDGPSVTARAGYLLAIGEIPLCADGDRVQIAIVGIQPATGDVVYDQFEDGVFRTELETRVAHLRPTELLRPPVLSRPTERFLAHWIAQCGDTGSSGGDGVRVERLKRDHPEYAKALVAVTEFLHQADKDASRLVADVSTLSRGVLAALASLLVYLREFGLERSLRLTSNFAPFASRRTIVLSANTLRNLELLQNDTDGQAYGSLLWVLDHTRTPMGKRLLRKWVAQPLRNREDVEARLDAVAELAQAARSGERTATTLVARLQALLPGLPDLERLLIRVHYGKTTPKEALVLLRALEAVDHAAVAAAAVPGAQPTAALLLRLAATLPAARGQAAALLRALDPQACERNTMADVFADPDVRAPAVAKRKLDIARCHDELAAHLKDLRSILGRPDLQYRSVSGTEAK